MAHARDTSIDYVKPAILVVDDEVIMRIDTVDLVEEAGFTAIEAKNADEALTLLESRSDIVLLLTDVQMPGSMDGLKLAYRVRDRWPPIKIVIVSGQVQLTTQDMPSGSLFLGKPFEAKKMIYHLRAALEN